MAHTKTDLAHSALRDVLSPAPGQADEMYEAFPEQILVANVF
jgi:hypothetical protein